MPSLAARAAGPELMDDPSVDEATFRDCLADLASVNSWTSKPASTSFNTFVTMNVSDRRGNVCTKMPMRRGRSTMETGML